MVVAHFEAEDVARHIELADLAAAVIQDLGGADGTADKLVEVLSRLILAVDLRIAHERHRRADQIESVLQRPRSEAAADVSGRSGVTVGRRALNGSFGQHCLRFPVVSVAKMLVPGQVVENSDNPPKGRSGGRAA